MAAMQRNSLVRLGILLLILGVTAVWVTVSTRERMNQSSERVREYVGEIIAAHGVYEQHAEYIDGPLLRAHERAFNRHYRIGVRFVVAPRFDHVQYASYVFTTMEDQAGDHGIDEVVTALREIGPHVDLAYLE